MCTFRPALIVCAGVCYVSLFSGIGRAHLPAPEGSDASPVAQTGVEQKPKEFLERTVTFSGQLRERWEATQGKNFTVTPADSYVASRIRLGVAFKPLSWLRFFGETQDSRAIFYKTNPTSSVSDPFDWRQGYVEVGMLEGNGINVRVGRQDFQLGSGRLVASADWSNVTKPFDIAVATVTYGSSTNQVVAGSILLIDPGRVDRSRPGEHLYADYSTFKKLIPGASVEPYVMAKTALNVWSKDGLL